MKKIIFTYFLFTILHSSFCSDARSQYLNNYVASFNGFSSYGSVPNFPEFNPVSAITLEAWVYPTQLGPNTMAVIGKNYQTSYFLGIQVSGRVVFYPNGGTPFRSRAFNTIPVNQWTHIAATYDNTTTAIYINGELDTLTTAISGAIGSNTDSLFIGADRVGTQTSLYFRGMLDNIRIWSNSRFAFAIAQNRFAPLEVFSPTGFYDALVASFQLDNDIGSYCGTGLRFGSPRNINFINFNGKSQNHIDYNNNLVLAGTDYFSVINQSGFNCTTGITLEAWIRRDTTGTQPNDQYIISKSGGTNRFDYALWLFSGDGSIKFKINNPGGPAGLISVSNITHGRWTHVAATYSSVDANARIYINGLLSASTFFSGGPLINDNPDPLYIGGIGASGFAGNYFKGQIDGVRIWNYARLSDQIRNSMYKILQTELGLTHFDFDKYTNAVYSGGGLIFTVNNFAGLAHVSSAHNQLNKELSSPILSETSPEFYSEGYSTSFRSFFVPDASQNGIKDSIFIHSSEYVSNLKVFLMLSHTWISDMSNISLISPSGTSVILFASKGGSGNDLMTVFSDAADSVASSGQFTNGPGIIPPFSPIIKPHQPLSAFNNQYVNGWWKLRLVDNSAGDVAYVNGWGISVESNYDKFLRLTVLIQGFYDNVANKLAKDTARVYLRNIDPPYNFLDTSVARLDSLGKASFRFDNTGVLSDESRGGPSPFFIVVTHRNSIETWSSAGYTFASDTLFYDFTLAASQAYQSNQILKGSEFCIYGGDMNQDGVVDLTDLVNIFNDANNFVNGYVITDVTGDNFVDLSDLTLTFNNSNNFVSKITPP